MLKNNRWASLYRASQDISADLDIEGVYVAIHNAAEKVMPCDDFIIDGFDEEANEVVPLYIIEPPRLRAYPPRYVADHGLAGGIIHTGKSILLNSPEEIIASGIRFELYGSRRVTRSLVAVPMRLRGKTAGMLSAQSYHPNAYTVEDQELLEMLASHAVVALENARLFQQLKHFAETDPLTGILNRRRFFEIAELEFARARRYRHPLSAVMMDLDHFKQFNDRHGHRAGDQYLQAVVEQCCRQIRSVDVFGRYGGDEFTLLLPETDLRSASQIAKRLRMAVEKFGETPANDPEFFEAAADMKVMLSMGVAALDPSCDGVEKLIDHADRALYQAKRAGGNRVKAWRGAR